MSRLWEPVSLGKLQLPNRLAMAPMTRDRATPSGAPTELNARYYAQRASMGLIISEGTQPSEDGQGYLLTPGVDVDEGLADIASVASLSLANPDLVKRLQTSAPLNEPDRATFFGGGEHGYTDYPALG